MLRMRTLESPAVRWTVAFLFFGVELLLFVVVLDPGDGSHYSITRADQLVMVIVSLFLFATIPSTLKSLSEEDEPFEYAADQVESTQRQRAAFVTNIVDKLARTIRIETTAPLVSWIAAGFLAILAGGTVTESVSGSPLQLILSTVVYLLLAAFAAPPVRRYLQQNFGVQFSRSIVIGILTAGVLITETILAPPIEEPAVMIPRVILPL